MKKILIFVLIAAMILGLCACGGAGKDKDQLKVGFGRVSILPKVQVNLDGGDIEGRPASDPIDDIAATCIAISQGDETILIYTLDLLLVQKTLLPAQELITEATGVPAENIILNTTHTHSAPAYNHTSGEAYRQPLYQACADAAVAAIEDLSPAQIEYGSTETESLTFVRHYRLEGGEIYGTHQSLRYTSKGPIQVKEHLYDANETLQVIKFIREAEDKKDVVMMNFGSHPTIVSGNHRFALSADWPGAARAYVEENTDSLCAVFQAGGGDQAPSSSVPNTSLFKGANEHRDMGAALGEYCVNILNGEMTKADGSGITLTTKQFTGATNKEGLDDASLMASASAIKEVERQYGSSSEEVRQAVVSSTFESYYHANALLNRAKFPETLTMDLHALVINGVSMIFAPYEMFGGMGAYITENSPYDMTFVVSCSESFEGHLGYIPTVYGYENNFYEYAQARFARGTAEEVAKLHVEMLNEIKNG